MHALPSCAQALPVIVPLRPISAAHFPAVWYALVPRLLTARRALRTSRSSRPRRRHTPLLYHSLNPTLISAGHRPVVQSPPLLSRPSDHATICPPSGPSVSLVPIELDFRANLCYVRSYPLVPGTCLLAPILECLLEMYCVRLMLCVKKKQRCLISHFRSLDALVAFILNYTEKWQDTTPTRSFYCSLHKVHRHLNRLCKQIP